MNSKYKLFLLIYVFGGLIVMFFSFRLFESNFFIIPVVLWFLGFGVSQFFIFRCPHCGKLAMKTPGGAYVPWIGNHCKSCGKDY
jgi:hypothetical protein